MTNQQALSDHLRDQARWRSDKADEYEDGRNVRSAKALLAAAEYVEGLPDDDPRLVRMDKASVFIVDVPSFGEEAQRVLRLWHFHKPTGSPSDLIDDLADASEKDWADLQPSKDDD